MKCLYLYNPEAGLKNFIKANKNIISKLKEKFLEVVVHESINREDFIATVKSSINYEYLIFCGGDGTFNMVVSTLANEIKKPILGYIPHGSVCDMSRNLGFGNNYHRALKAILKGKVISRDLGKINDFYFAYAAAIGKFTAVPYQTLRKHKKIFGKFAYYFACARALFIDKDNPIQIRIKEEKKDYLTPLFLVVNSKSMGGFNFNPEGNRNDGTFDIYIVKNSFLKGLFNMIMGILFSKLRIQKMKYSDYYQSHIVEVKVNENTVWDIDGEEGCKGDAIIQVLPNNYQIFSK